MSLSIAESEYIVASKCSREILYQREILRGFHCEQKEPTILFDDNLACVNSMHCSVAEPSSSGAIQAHQCAKVLREGSGRSRSSQAVPVWHKKYGGRRSDEEPGLSCLSAHSAIMLGENGALMEQLVFVRSVGGLCFGTPKTIFGFVTNAA